MRMNVRIVQQVITAQEVEQLQLVNVLQDIIVLEKPLLQTQLILPLEIYAHKVITALQALLNQQNVQKVL